MCFAFPGRKHLGLAQKAALSWSLPGSPAPSGELCLVVSSVVLSERTKDLRVASCWSQELVLSLLCALPLFSTVNGSKATQSVLKEQKEEEMQYLAMLPRWCWVGPGAGWKLCGRCGAERANVWHPHGQHSQAVVLWQTLHPALLPCKLSQGKKGVLQLWDGAEGYPRGDLEQLPKSQHLPVWQRRKEML